MDSKDEDTSNVRVPVNSLFSPSEGPSEGFGKLDSIFEEVEKNLPSIDFDVSDVSSDEEVAIFQRSIRTPTFDEDKDLDESLTSYSWDELLQAQQQNGRQASCSTPDNDAMASDAVTSSVTRPVPTTASTKGLINMESQLIRSGNQELSEVLPETADSVSTLSLRSIREVENEMESDISSNLVTQSRSVRTQSTGTTTVQKNSIKINNWMVSDSKRNDSYSGLGKGPDVEEIERSVLDNKLDKNQQSDEENRSKPKDLVSRYLPSQALSLTFQDLENIDLDAALETPPGGRPGSLPLRRPLSAPQSTAPRSETSRTTPRVGSASGTAVGTAVLQADDDENVSLIEKLARLSVVQSGQAMREYNPETGALSRPPPAAPTGDGQQMGQKQQAVDAKAIKTAKNKHMEAIQKSGSLPPPPGPVGGLSFAEGFLSQLGAPKRQRPPRDTVFIDLRHFDVEKHQQKLSFEAVQRILRLPPQTQAEESSSDEEGEEGAGSNLTLWHEQRRKMKEALRAGKTIATPESYETEKPVETSKPANTSRSKESSIPEDKSTETPQTTTKQAEVEESTVKETTPKEVTPSKPDTVRPAASPPKAETVDKERQERLEAARKARAVREAEHQSRLRLGQHLEALRPTTIVSGRQPAAEATPLVFDLEASYEPAPETMPPDVGRSREVILLTVHLSSNGEIILHRGAANKSVDSGHGLSASYTTLVTWLLSLVPDDFSFLKSSPKGGAPPAGHPQTVPFQVVALQQMVLEDQMGLYIAVCPTETRAYRDTSPKAKKTKKRGDDFSGALTKFLSTHTLLTVCSWLEDLVSLEVTSPLSDGKKPFIYRPPLPNITNKPLSTFIQVNGGGEAARRVFSLPAGFFWHTVEAEDTLADVGASGADPDMQNTMSLVYKRIYRDPRAMMGILNRLLQEGLDLSGLRLLYPTTALMSVAAGNLSSPNHPKQTSQNNSPIELDLLNKVGPILALAIRGTLARTLWLDAVGPADPVLARRTDPNSLCALYGGLSREECLLFCPRNPERISTELARWFGGRVPANGVVNVGTAHRKQQQSAGGKKSKGGKSGSDQSDLDLPSHTPPAMLSATSRGHVLLVISPLVPPRCLGLVLATCQRRGYQLHGVRRQRLTAKRASSLGLAGVQIPVFTRGRSSSLLSEGASYPDITADPAGGDAPPTPARPSTAILLNKENALHSAASLIEAFMVQLCLMDLLGSVQANLSEPLTSALLFHTLPHSDAGMNVLGRDFSKVPEVDRVITPGYIAPKLHTNPEMEQVVMVTFTGDKNIKTFGLLLGRLTGVVPLSRAPRPPPTDAFELLAMKWLPSLSMQHAKELTPHEVGDPQWRASLQTLMSGPAVVVALRGVNAFQRLEVILGCQQSSFPHRPQPRPNLECLLARSPDATYRQMALFFTDREVFADNSVRSLLDLLPPLRPHRALLSDRLTSSDELAEESQEESLFETLTSGPRPLVTLMVVKPDAVRRHLGKVLKRLALDGFALVGARLQVLTEEQADRVIPTEDKENEVLVGMHRTYLTSAPSMILAVQRENAVCRLLQLLGPADPQVARQRGQHYWRALFGSDAIVNGLHGSASYAVAVDEVRLFFPDGLCCQPNLDLEEDGIPCPLEDKVIDIRPTRTAIVSESEDQASIPIATTKSSGTVPVNWTLPTSTLTETNCILLTPSLLRQQARGRKAPYVDVTDALFNNGFDIIGARLVWLTETQAEHYLCLIKAGSFQMVPLLMAGPCLVLALQRDNAVIAFDSLLGTSYVKDSVYSKYGAQILRPKDSKQALKHLAFFFDSLSPVAQLKIVPGEVLPNSQHT